MRPRAHRNVTSRPWTGTDGIGPCARNRTKQRGAHAGGAFKAVPLTQGASAGVVVVVVGGVAGWLLGKRTMSRRSPSWAICLSARQSSNWFGGGFNCVCGGVGEVSFGVDLCYALACGVCPGVELRLGCRGYWRCSFHLKGGRRLMVELVDTWKLETSWLGSLRNSGPWRLDATHLGLAPPLRCAWLPPGGLGKDARSNT